jgi:hypothetical protein
MTQTEVANDALRMCFRVLTDSGYASSWNVDEDGMMIDLNESGILFFKSLGYATEFLEVLKKVVIVIGEVSEVTYHLINNVIKDAIEKIEELSIYWGAFSKS